MHPLVLLSIEIAASLLLSLIVVIYLRDVLLELLDKACSQGGSHFWVKTLALLQFLAPLLLVVWQADIGPVAYPASELKSALGWMLLGHCASLLLLAKIIWKALVVPVLPTTASNT